MKYPGYTADKRFSCWGAPLSSAGYTERTHGVYMEAPIEVSRSSDKIELRMSQYDKM